MKAMGPNGDESRHNDVSFIAQCEDPLDAKEDHIPNTLNKVKSLENLRHTIKSREQSLKKKMQALTNDSNNDIGINDL